MDGWPRFSFNIRKSLMKEFEVKQAKKQERTFRLLGGDRFWQQARGSSSHFFLGLQIFLKIAILPNLITPGPENLEKLANLCSKNQGLLLIREKRRKFWQNLGNFSQVKLKAMKPACVFHGPWEEKEEILFYRKFYHRFSVFLGRMP